MALTVSSFPLAGLGGLMGFDDPFFSGIERAMDRAFSRGAAAPSDQQGARVGIPNFFRTVAGSTPMDIHESDKGYVITADAPGFKPQEVQVEEHNGVLTIRGCKDESKEERDQKGAVLRQERTYRAFTRSFTLPETAEASQIQAKIENGILCVCIPKNEKAMKKAEPRRIGVSGGECSMAEVGSGQQQKAASESGHKQAGQ